MKRKLSLLFILVFGLVVFILFLFFNYTQDDSNPTQPKPPGQDAGGFLWETSIHVRHEKLKGREVYTMEELDSMFDKLAEEFGDENIDFKLYIGNDATGLRGFVVELSNNGRKLLPYNPNEHEKFFERNGFWLDYSSLVYTGEDSVPASEKDLFSCIEDNDCVRVNADCCGCHAGGTSTSINIKYKSYWDDEYSSECEDVACLDVYSCPPNMKIECIRNKCKLTSKGRFF